MQKTVTTLILFLIYSIAYAEFDFDAYRPTTFAAIKALHSDDLLNAGRKSDYIVSAATFKYSLPVNFSRELRKITADNKTVITAWQKTLRVPDDFINLYQQEFKLVFGKETYWIPVQEGLLPAMGAELLPGDRFELYVIVIGAIKNRLVFLSTEFRSDRAPQ